MSHWLAERHNIKYVEFGKGLTDAQIKDAIKFIYPEEKKNNTPAKHLKSLAVFRSHAKPKSTVCSTSPVKGPILAFCRSLAEMRLEDSSGSPSA